MRPETAFLLLTGPLLAGSPSAQTTSPVSSDLGNFGRSTNPSISDDGRFIAFETVGDSSPGDTCDDIVVRDLVAGTTVTVAACDNTVIGAPAWNSDNPALAGDGSWVAYERLAASGSGTHVHVAPVGPGSAFIATVDDFGLLGNAGGLYPTIDADGDQIAFQSLSTNFVVPALGFNNVWNIWVRDASTGRTVLVSESVLGGASSNGHSQYPSISRDGRFVAFESLAQDLVAAGLDTNGTQDVYVRDRDPDGNGVYDEGNATTTLLSDDGAGMAAQQGGQKPAISADGRYVAFLSIAPEHVGIPGNKWQVVVVDRDSDGNGDFTDTPGVFDHVSPPKTGAFVLDCYHPSITADGRFVAYSTFSSNLVANDTNGSGDAFVFDRVTRQSVRVSVDSYGSQGDGHSIGGWYSDDPAISGDGTRVAFSSQATNLVAGDTNGYEDVFAHDLCPPVGIDLGYALAGTGGLAPVLTACGDAASGGTVRVRLRDGLPSAPSILVAGLVSNPTPYAGGTIVPIPRGFLQASSTDALGGLDLTAPGGAGPLDVYVQAAVLDPGAPQGVAFANALRVPFLP